MFMIVEFCTQHFKGKSEAVCSFFLRLVDDIYLTTSNLFAVVQESCKDATTERELVIFALQFRTELCVLHTVFELYPNGIIGIIKEYSRDLFSLQYLLFASLSLPDY